MSSASSSVDNYYDILEMGRQKMNEGDYLQLAKFLETLHKKKDESQIVRTINNNINLSVSFETLKGKSIVIHVNTVRKDVIRGSVPDKMYVIGLWNGTPFEYEKQHFIKKILNILTMFGMKNIMQTIDGITETFDKFGLYKAYLADLYENHNDDDDSNESFEPCENYAISVLFGLWAVFIVD